MYTKHIVDVADATYTIPKKREIFGFPSPATRNVNKITLYHLGQPSISNE